MNIKGLPNGKPGDFRQRSDCHEALTFIDDLDPDWVLGAPPCTAFSNWNYGLNYKKMDGEAIRAKLAEGRMHPQLLLSDVPAPSEAGDIPPP